MKANGRRHAPAANIFNLVAVEDSKRRGGWQR